MSGLNPKRPNFLIILADDLGYSDIGCFGSEIHTPNIDKLAQDGLRFTDYHTAAVCSPTRSMLMSGTDCHLAGMGIMFEFKTVDPERWNVPGHEGYLNLDVATIPEILKDAGYHTFMSGKWHLGWKDELLPNNRGFERVFSFLPGAGNHFAWEPHWEVQEGLTMTDALGQSRPKKWVPGHSLPLYCENGERLLPDANTSNDPTKGFYSSKTFTDKLISFIDERPTSSTGEKQPFFSYLPFTAPHFPLQCSQEDRDRYKGVYSKGYEALRQSRLQGMKDLDIIGKGTEAHPVMIADNIREHATSTKWDDWESLSEEEKSMTSRAMECFAGMVTAIDREVGKIVEYLRETGELDDTFIIFHSDNGAEGDAYEANPAMGPDLMSVLNKYYDNSLDNIGNHDSFVWYGPRWAQASTAPSRLYKAYSTEGGIKVPCVMRYPPWTKQHSPGSILRPFSTCMDLMPTILEMAGVKHPNSNPSHSKEKVEYHGRQVYPSRGRSWLPFLQDGRADDSETADEMNAIHGSTSTPVGWEMFGRGALRKGQWKINHMNANDFGTGEWQLYDLSKDPGEIHDLAKEMLKKLEELKRDFDTYVKETGTVWGPPVNMKQARTPLPPNIIGGDPIQDQKAWMSVRRGGKLPAAA